MNFGDPFRLLHVIIKGIVIKEGIIINEGGEASPSRRAPSAQSPPRKSLTGRGAGR